MTSPHDLAAETIAGAGSPGMFQHGQNVEPHLFVILGGTGDLSRKKLFPALRRLAAEGRLGNDRALIAVARECDRGDEWFREWALEQLKAAGFSSDDLSDVPAARLFYHAMPESTPELYEDLAKRVKEIEKEYNLPGNRVFYLAIPPSSFAETVELLAESGLTESGGWTRVVLEKPFGRDLVSAQTLNRAVQAHLDEKQVYRIDHYLGKETVQNLLVFRFSNPVFESLWNRDRIESVQITVAESIGIGSRAGYYDKSGAVRDMVQNHAAQLLALIGMEVPGEFHAEAVRYEKLKLLTAVRPVFDDDAVFGQYARGVIEGEPVPGYLEEPGVDPESTTETFAAIKFSIDNWRWQGVPFYVRTGKRLPVGLTQIAVTFRAPPVRIFQAMGAGQVDSNVLYLTLQPDEGFALMIDVKVPGHPFRLRRLPLDFYYRHAFGVIPDAYQTLLLDTLTGDQTLFVHAEEVETSWALFEPLLLMEDQRQVQLYRAGTWGPAAAETLIARDGFQWRHLIPPGQDIEAGEAVG
ncbi:MAG: glucose-6-phosphate dehydrogenase [Gemmatimonadetes bacterium]|nr:glucose-6-phosphate dehydrogenase [Gemmatimonadota bacterium]